MSRMSGSRLSFVAIDFETANMDKASVCQVGIAKVVNGEIVESTSWLVKPPTGLTAFEPRFISIHGITPRAVRRSGISWQESLRRISNIAGDLPFVAHNIGFDRTVYTRASERVGISVTVGQWFDTLTLARRYVTAPNHKLPTVAKALSLPDFSHHEAEADAITSARIALEIGHQQQLHTIQELWNRPAKKSYEVSPRPRRQAERPKFSRVADLPSPNSNANPDHPFFGRHVVITGNLNGYTRDEFIIKVAELGAQPQLNVTKKTTMLIVAHQKTITADYDYSYGTGKERKAIEYKAAGQMIEIIGSQQALQYLHAQELKVERPAAAAEVQEPSPLRATDTPQVAKSSSRRSQRARQRSFRIPNTLMKALAWFLMITSGLCIILFVIGTTGTMFSADYPEATFFTWAISLSLVVPLMSAPGVLGLYLLRRSQKRKRARVSV